MYTNKELANALLVLNRECVSHNRCCDCPLQYKKYVWEKEFCMLDKLSADGLEGNMIKELGERDG